jgi:hypothetical protein
VRPTYRLDKLFAPRSIAVVGGSPRDTSPGRAVLKNLCSGGFSGAIHLVNPHYDSLEGVAAVKSCDALPDTPDIVVANAAPSTRRKKLGWLRWVAALERIDLAAGGARPEEKIRRHHWLHFTQLTTLTPSLWSTCRTTSVPTAP